MLQDETKDDASDKNRDASLLSKSMKQMKRKMVALKIK